LICKGNCIGEKGRRGEGERMRRGEDERMRR